MKYRFQSPSKFSNDLKEKGKNVILESPSNRYANKSQWFVMVLISILFVFSYVFIVTSNIDLYSIIGSVLVGFACYGVVSLIGHDASHSTLSKYKLINRIALFFSFMLIGVSGYLWAKRHVRIHHQATNIVGNNIDGDDSVLLRFHHSKEYKPWHKFQFIYAPFLYLFVLMHLAWFDDFNYLKKDISGASDTFNIIIEFILTKVLHILLAIVMPLYYFDSRPEMILLCYIIASMSASLLFVIINIGTHINIHSELVTTNNNNEIANDWVKHQLETTVDWSPESKVAEILTGGANSHIAHHLFPYVAHCHNAKLTAIIKETTEEHAIVKSEISFLQMLSGHFKLLYKYSIQ